MRAHLVRSLSAVLLLATLALGADDKAFFGIFVETAVMKSPGMPDMSAMLQNLPPEALANLPPQVRAMMAGGATRRVTMRYWYPGTAPQGASAQVLAPDGFGQGEKLPMQLIRPGQIIREGGENEGGEEVTTMPQGKMRIEIYWGSSPTVRPGQPKVIEVDFAAMTPEVRAEWQARMREGGGFFHEDWTQAVWPKPSDQPDFEGAEMTGTFTLESSYGNGVSIDVPDTVGFLDPIQFSQPDLKQSPDFAEAISFEWPAIANVLGYHCQIVGIQDSTITIWNAGEAEPQNDGAYNLDFMQMADVRRMVAEEQFMPGEADTFTVPAGIFAERGMVTMTMTGFGTGAARDDVEPLPRVQTKTTFTSMLSGMGGMGGMAMPGGQAPQRRPRG